MNNHLQRKTIYPHQRPVKVCLMLLSSRFNNLTPIITLPGGDLDAESPSDSEGEKGEDELHLMGAALEREFLGLGD